MRIWIAILALSLQACSGSGQVASASPSTESETPVRSPSNTPAADTAIERQVLYHPNNKTYGTIPEGVEMVNVSTPDGLQLKAWYSEAPQGGKTVCYFHGNGGNLSSLGNQVAAFKEAGLGVFALDYRGFGESEGEPSEQGLYIDGLAAFDHAASLVGNEELIVYGRSLGGGVACYVAAERKCKGLVLESTFTSAKEVARFSHGQAGADAVDAFDNLEKVSKITEPVLLIHGTKDETIPSFMSEELHKAFPGSVLWLVEGVNHGNIKTKAGLEYQARLKAFIEGL